MHIEEIFIDGFKSFPRRTVISGFDPEFNAITGGSGSGKSNILDAICFVLGTPNLSRLRANNLDDLIYKDGQAGITRAAVTLVFNNADTAVSPLGYEQHKMITVTRWYSNATQWPSTGGRNKYLINGLNAQLQHVQNLFHSIGLFVDSPHFIVMQGRIVRIRNMKPMEMLGMIEEAAGTKMFEARKQSTIQAIKECKPVAMVAKAAADALEAAAPFCSADQVTACSEKLASLSPALQLLSELQPGSGIDRVTESYNTMVCTTSMEVLDVLDRERKVQLQTASAKVNADLGSIFDTLLPGACAKMEPEEGCSLEEGLVLKVGFGSGSSVSERQRRFPLEWRELSGGQQSLACLSLMFSMLKTKGCHRLPICLLDEVDSAIHSATQAQHYGQMMKEHFPQTQFIVISYKEAVYNNANVIFRTSFEAIPQFGASSCVAGYVSERHVRMLAEKMSAHRDLVRWLLLCAAGKATLAPLTSDSGLEALSYRQLQARAKQAGLRANQKRESLLAGLRSSNPPTDRLGLLAAMTTGGHTDIVELLLAQLRPPPSQQAIVAKWESQGRRGQVSIAK